MNYHSLKFRYSILLGLVFVVSACGASAEETPTPTNSPTFTSVPSTPTPQSEDSILQSKITQTPTPTPFYSPTPTVDYTKIDYADYIDVWYEYVDVELGIRFEYPAIYDDGELKCGPNKKYYDDRTTIYVGARYDISFKNRDDRTLEQVLDDFITEYSESDPGFQIQAVKEGFIAEEPAVILEYRFGSLGRYAELKYFYHGPYLIQSGFTAGAFCDVPEAGVQELGMIDHLEESLEFLK